MADIGIGEGGSIPLPVPDDFTLGGPQSKKPLGPQDIGDDTIKRFKGDGGYFGVNPGFPKLTLEYDVDVSSLAEEIADMLDLEALIGKKNNILNKGKNLIKNTKENIDDLEKQLESSDLPDEKKQELRKLIKDAKEKLKEFEETLSKFAGDVTPEEFEALCNELKEKLGELKGALAAVVSFQSGNNDIGGAQNKIEEDFKKDSEKVNKEINSSSASGDKSNPWFEANPVLALTSAILKLSTILSKTKVSEGKLAAEEFGHIMETAILIAEMTFSIAMKQAAIYRTQAIAAVAKAVTSAVIGAVTLVASVGIPYGKKTKTEVPDGVGGSTIKTTKTPARWGKLEGGYASASGLSQAAQGFATNSADAVMNFILERLEKEKGAMEAKKVILESLMKLSEKMQEAAFTSRKEAAEALNEALQLLQRVASENLKTFTLSKG